MIKKDISNRPRRFPVKFIETLTRAARNSDRSAQLLAIVIKRLDKLIEAQDHQSHAVNARLDKLIEARDHQSHAVNARLDKLIEAADKASSPRAWPDSYFLEYQDRVAVSCGKKDVAYASIAIGEVNRL